MDQRPSPHVVIVGRKPDAVDLERAVFSEAGIRVTTLAQPPEGSGLPDEIRNADGILQAGSWPVTREVIGQLTRCRVVGRYGLGYDNIDVDAATERGIAVVTARGYCEEEISDHVLAFLLSWHRRIPFYDRLHRSGVRQKLAHPIPRISTLTGGLCGFGGIARCLAPKLKALGMHVVAFDPFLPNELFTQFGVERVDFDGLLARADVISIHCALTDETRHLFNEAAFKAMKPNALIINTARGGIIDTGALVSALQAGEIAGAGLDVLEEGDFERYRLHEIETLLHTPHMAWQSETARVELARRSAFNVRLVLEGKRPDGLVNSNVIPALNLVG